MTSFVVGTAGHIDHGKSSLVKALTGINPDRLKEEQEREMTIDLGFAHLTLPSGNKVGIVDVPGHERFIKNMLAGATGIDLVLFVVAADEGMMPQSREHLDILNLLGLKNGFVVVSKRDLVDDEWYELIVEDIKSELKGSFLEGAPLIPVSSRTGEGIEEVKRLLDEYSEKIETKPQDAPARFPIDRVFSIAGFGTVVTGTLWEGIIRVGTEVVLLPQSILVRVRNLQTYKEEVQEAQAAVRLAINIAGAEKSMIERGNVLAEPGYFKASSLLDVKLTLLKDAPYLQHAELVHFHLGTTETIGKVRLLYQDKLQASEESYAQITLEEPVVAKRGDRFVIRRFSPLVTIGGGVVLNPYTRRRRVREKAYLQELKTYETASDEEFVKYLLANAGFEGIAYEELKMASSIKENTLKELLATLKGQKEAFSLGERWFDENVEGRGRELVKRELENYFKLNPWAPGMDREELRSKIKISDRRLYGYILNSLTNLGMIEMDQDLVKLTDRSVDLSPEDLKIRSKIEETFLSMLFYPPLPEDVWESFGKDSKQAKKLFNALVEEKIVVKVAPDIYFHKNAIQEAQKKVAEYIAKQGSISVAEMRDLLKTSRKYALPLLEYFDKIGFTKRTGDTRTLSS